MQFSPFELKPRIESFIVRPARNQSGDGCVAGGEAERLARREAAVSDTYKGSCFCGAVEFEVAGAPAATSISASAPKAAIPDEIRAARLVLRDHRPKPVIPAVR